MSCFFRFWLVHWLRWNMNCAWATLTSRKRCDCCDWLSFSFFAPSPSFSSAFLSVWALFLFSVHHFKLVFLFFVFLYWVLFSFLASEWEHPRAPNRHSHTAPCEILKHPSLAKLHLLPEEAADKNSSFWRIVLGAAGYSHWNSFVLLETRQ